MPTTRHSRTPTPTPIVIDTISAMAAAELAAADNDVAAATIAMTEKIMSDQVLYRTLMDPLVRSACYKAISSVCSQQRRAIWQQPQPTAAQNRQAVAASANGARLSLFNYQLPGGKELGDAVWSEVNSASDKYRKQVKTMNHEQRWLALVAKPMKSRPTQTVRQLFTLAKLQNLKTKANGVSR